MLAQLMTIHRLDGKGLFTETRLSYVGSRGAERALMKGGRNPMVIGEEISQH